MTLMCWSCRQRTPNTTHTLSIMSRTDVTPPVNGEQMVTTGLHRAQCAGGPVQVACGFATNGINLTKLESYIRPGSHHNAQFYVDVEGHIDCPTCSWRWMNCGSIVRMAR